MNEQYPSNSHKSKEESPKPRAQQMVPAGEAKIHEKTFGERVKEELFKGDVKKASNYVAKSVLLPAFKKSVLNGVESFLNVLFNDDSSTKDSDRDNSSTSRISYTRYYDRASEKRYSEEPARKVYEFGDLEVKTYDKAEGVIRQLTDIISEYQVATVADMYECAGIENYDYTCHNYGWANVASAKIVQTDYGYLIKMPKASPIERG